MKVKFSLFILLIFTFSANLSAVTTTVIPENTRTAKITEVKKKPVKKFFQNMTQRVLENKIGKRIKAKLAREKRSGFFVGLLSLITAVLGIFSIALINSFDIPALVIGMVLGNLAFILGLIGIFNDRGKVLSSIGITLGALFFLASIVLLFSWF